MSRFCVPTIDLIGIADIPATVLESLPTVVDDPDMFRVSILSMHPEMFREVNADTGEIRCEWRVCVLLRNAADSDENLIVRSVSACRPGDSFASVADEFVAAVASNLLHAIREMIAQEGVADD